MKRYTLYILLLTASMVGCKKQSDPFMPDPDTRLAAQLTGIQKALLAAPNGWKATVFPKGGKGFFYYINFKEDGTVVMLSDFSTVTASTPKTSTYRLKALQKPTLIFDSYSYIHLPADPDAGVNGGTTANGLVWDFEFAMGDVAGDSIKMVGIDNGNTMVMVKLGSEEAKSIVDGKLGAAIQRHADFIAAHKYPYLQLNDTTQVGISFNTSAKNLKLTYADAGGNVQSQSADYALTLTGVAMEAPFSGFDQSFQELFWDETTVNYYIKVGENRNYVRYSSFPILPAEGMVGAGKEYTYIDYNPATLKGTVGASFDALFTATKAKVLTATSTKRVLNYIRLTFNADKTATLRFNYTSSKDYNADVIYNVTTTPEGRIDFEFLSQNSNADGITKALTDVKTVLENNTWKLNWVSNTIAGSTALLAGMYSTTDANVVIYGAAGK